MRIVQIKTNNKDNNYPILIGSGILNVLPKKIKSLCPKTKKIALIIDKKVPRKFIYKLRRALKRYQVFIKPAHIYSKRNDQRAHNFYR